MRDYEKVVRSLEYIPVCLTNILNESCLNFKSLIGINFNHATISGKSTFWRALVHDEEGTATALKHLSVQQSLHQAFIKHNS